MDDKFNQSLEALTEIFREVEGDMPAEAQKALEGHLEALLKHYQDGAAARQRAEQVTRLTRLLTEHPEHFYIDNATLGVWERRLAQGTMTTRDVTEAIHADDLPPEPVEATLIEPVLQAGIRPMEVTIPTMQTVGINMPTPVAPARPRPVFNTPPPRAGETFGDWDRRRIEAQRVWEREQARQAAQEAHQTRLNGLIQNMWEVQQPRPGDTVDF